MTKKVIQPGQGRSNTGRSVMYKFHMDASVAEWDDTFQTTVECPGNIKMKTLLAKLEVALEMRGCTMDAQFLQISRERNPLPDTRTDESRKEQA